MEYDKNDKGFWMQTYVPFFKELLKQQLFAEFSYYCLQSSENKSHQKLIAKNTESIKKFVTWAGAALNKINSVIMTMLDGKCNHYAILIIIKVIPY